MEKSFVNSHKKSIVNEILLNRLCLLHVLSVFLIQSQGKKSENEKKKRNIRVLKWTSFDVCEINAPAQLINVEKHLILLAGNLLANLRNFSEISIQ